jgi:hypothetical protein
MNNEDSILEKKRSEFYYELWNHSEDEFQASFDERRVLSPTELAFLKGMVDLFKINAPNTEFDSYMKSNFQKEPKLIEILLQICGMTRNKILTDLRATPEAKNYKLSSHLTLVNHAATWTASANYLVKKAKRVLYQPLISDEDKIYEIVNQATWPGYIRQERAKRSGHEAEYRIATLLNKCGIDFVPEEKSENPLCKDAMLHGVSFDIVVPNLKNPTLLIKSTVHTSDIGQYGESKDDLEMREAKEMIATNFRDNAPILVGFIDGVGFKSNSAGLNGVLNNADEFCQFNTVWKLVILSCVGNNFKCKLFAEPEILERHKDFINKYSNLIQLVQVDERGLIEAGNASVKVVR